VTIVNDYTEPANAGGPIITTVNFSYELELNDFSEDLDLEESIPGVLNVSDREGMAVLVKTNKGWKAQLVNW
jgi:hypothetical protein